MKTTLMFFLLLCTACIHAQQFNYFEGFTNLPAVLDTTQQGNQWQQGLPDVLVVQVQMHGRSFSKSIIRRRP